MLSNFTQYSPQGLIPQFPGLQTAGLPQLTQGLFGQGQPNPYNGPGSYNGQGQFGHELAQNPNQQSPWLQNPGSHHSPQSAFGGAAGVNVPVQQIVPFLAQLAQQIAVQSAIAQQIGIAVHQLAHQLAAQGPQGYPGAGQALAGMPPFGGASQGFAPPSPFVGYAGFNPQGGFNPQQAQAWGANRAQTIQ